MHPTQTCPNPNFQLYDPNLQSWCLNYVKQKLPDGNFTGFNREKLEKACHLNATHFPSSISEDCENRIREAVRFLCKKGQANLAKDIANVCDGDNNSNRVSTFSIAVMSGAAVFAITFIGCLAYALFKRPRVVAAQPPGGIPEAHQA